MLLCLATNNKNYFGFQNILKNIPLQQMGEPEDVANVAYFLASDSAKYITGQVINVDGGMVM